MDFEIIKSLLNEVDTKIVLLVIDGLGGLPMVEGGKTELETANTPNLDSLASKSNCGLSEAISPGITPGSGPSHLALFGYDPLKYQIGRGVLEALGIGFEMTKRDLACRANFATMKDGIITDRRAGRIPTEKNEQLCKLLAEKIGKIDDVEVIIRPGKEHRFVVVFRGDGLSDGLTESDPQKPGLKPLKIEALNEGAKKSAEIANKFIERVNEVLKDERPANTALLRGLAKHPDIPSMKEVFGLKTAAIANYPMYKGLARLVGMDILETGSTIESEFNTLEKNFAKFDFFYVHIKKTDSYGEDGNFEAKVGIIEEVDKFIPRLEALKPEVIVVTGDHSTPAKLKAHSWHPNPFLLYSPVCLADKVQVFSERECASNGGLGRFPATEAIPLMLAHSLRLNKYGA